jgi:2Fe-2S ferredoxin
MPRITYITSENQSYEVDVPVGTNLMNAALDNGVPGIDGDCGGACACGTCLVQVDPAFAAKVGEPASDMEQEMLSLTDAATSTSRLGCQVTMTEELDGLIVRLPDGQH